MAKIARAQIARPGQESMFESPAQTLTRVLVPGASARRFSRVWRLGHTNVSDEELLGRIGFEGERRTFMWNEESKDFLPGPSPNGLVVPFVINLANFQVVFQIRPPEIRPHSFTGALERILRDATGQDWGVEPIIRQMSFEAWRATVTKVTRMHFHVEQPNPNWEGRPELENLMHRLGDLDSADFGFNAENGIATDDELIVELVNHVNQRNYGRSQAVGIREFDSHVVESVLDSASGETEEIGSLAEVPRGDGDLALLMGEIEQAEQAEGDQGSLFELGGAESAGESEADV
jgi:hypothetical protein